MDKTAQRIAIAEACGWKYCPNRKCNDPEIVKEYGLYWLTPDGEQSVYVSEEDIPDYFNDLNAMHEAEQVLKKWEKVTYAKKLVFTVTSEEKRGTSTYELIIATAAQRAEAFLRTLGKWEESS